MGDAFDEAVHHGIPTQVGPFPTQRNRNETEAKNALQLAPRTSMAKDNPQNMDSHVDMAVFITRFGLSDRTAIGVQTRHLVNQFTSWRHLYWHESAFERAPANSIRLETMLFSKLSILKRDNFLSRALRRLGFSWWRDDDPSDHLLNILARSTADARSLYLAPIEAEDARRMKAIVKATSLPFVIHLWDFLDNIADQDTEWLIANAEHVFCLNAAMLSVVRPQNANASILTFIRDAAVVTSAYSAPDEMVVALIGDIGAYIDGVRVLIDAVSHLRSQDIKCRILYVGAKKTLRRHKLNDLPFMSATGFLRDPADKDLILSKCQVAFLPGPAQSPEQDARSRFSIPSRLLDFLALGLPIVGTVHPSSATYDMCQHLGVETAILNCGAIELADRLRDLKHETAWRKASEQSLSGFSALTAEYDTGLLVETMIRRG
jgi:hypothetical protein